MSKSKRKSESRGRRTFTEEFKKDAVNLVVVQGYSLKRAADAVGVCAEFCASQKVATTNG
jgi:transposase-like protein